MKGGAWFALYAAGAFALGGALAGPVHAALAAIGIAPMAFPEFTLRLVQLFALVGLWPLLHVLDLSGAGVWGLAPRPAGSAFLTGAITGFVAGAAMMAAVLAVLVLLGARSGATSLSGIEWPARLGRFFAVAALVALIEEVWFRGALHSAFQRIGGVSAAILAVAALYSAVHFIDPAMAIAAESRGVGGGFAVLGDAFHRFSRSEIAGPAAALLAAGVLLGIVRYRRGGVAECIGIHAGWVLVNKTGRVLTVPEPDSRWAWLASGLDGIVGWAAFVIFSLVALFGWYRLGPSRTPH